MTATSQQGLKIRCHQFNTVVGDLQGNRDAAVAALRQAEADGVDLLVLPELCICGYPPMDLLERRSFLDACAQSVEMLVAETRTTALLFGAPVRNTSGFGRPIHNAIVLAENGAEVTRRFKTLLPTYDVFDELRYFEPAAMNRPVEWRGLCLGLTICEDIWNVDNEKVYHVYDRDPSAELAAAGAEIIINISASPYTRRKAEVRRRMLAAHAQQLRIPFVYCNQCGANTEIIFDGDSMMVNHFGDVICGAPMFDEGWVDGYFHEGQLRAAQPLRAGLPTMEERTFRALIIGIRDYFRKSGIPSKAVLGLSGGIDSALVAVLACEALGADNVVALTMPSRYSSEGSVDDSLALAQNLGMRLEQVPIGPVFDAALASLEPVFDGAGPNVAEENLQSRIRGMFLMAFSNKHGHLLLNTGNKSELATGYCTLYGDMNGGLALISDLYKTEVYRLCRWLNERYFMREVIPEAILTKEPSAELAPGQKDTDTLPPYDTLDGILHLYLEDQYPAGEIIAAGFDAETVHRVIHLVFVTEFKRRQAPPGLRLSPKAFGVGRRIPIVQRFKDPR